VLHGVSCLESDIVVVEANADCSYPYSWYVSV
jgi:hypothetical protein